MLHFVYRGMDVILDTDGSIGHNSKGQYNFRIHDVTNDDRWATPAYPIQSDSERRPLWKVATGELGASLIAEARGGCVDTNSVCVI